MAHVARKCYTNVKTNLVSAGINAIILSQMDTAFMFTYAIGSFISGRLGDTFPQNVILGVGLIGSTLCLGLIWLFEVVDLVNFNYALGFFGFVFAQFLHGFFQSTGGPVNTSIMGNWFPKKGRGLTFGLWTCHQYVGDIISGLATAAIINAGFDWRYALTVPGLLSGVWGVVNFYFLPNSPAEVGLQSEDDKKAEASGTSKGGGTIGFMQALQIPNVIGYALAFGFFKFVNYAMFFWLPFFLSIHFDTQSANIISSLYSFGMMPGGVIVGWVSDLFGGRRACVIAVFMTLLAPLLWVFAVFSGTMNPILLLVLLCLMGILVGGPNNIITSAVAADLAEHPSIGGNTRSLGTVTGIINGSGSITASFGLMLIGPLQELGGWTAVWYFLILCVVAGTGLMSPNIVKELKQ
uniref:Major facilitator superfamily (MFS) profile domain-containing protein n=1 Tax=Haptolina brevifila TaxID=156173 RepID=A0A7S2N9V8_9EUKA